MGVWAPCTEPDRSGSDLQAQGGLCDEVGLGWTDLCPNQNRPWNVTYATGPTGKAICFEYVQ